MKKYGLRVLVGLIAFTVGLSAFFIWEFSKFRIGKNVELKRNCRQTLNFSASKNFEDGIEIRFVGIGRIENRPTLIFEIINHNDYPVKYWSFKEKTIWTKVKFNGQEKYVWVCGNGPKPQEFNLEARESFKVETQADSEIIEFLNQKGYFEFGYNLGINKKDWKPYWSQPITISDELKKDIIKNAPEFLKPDRNG